MRLGFAAWLIVLGILGASNLIIAKKPDAKELIAKLAPYQGWLGAGAALTGVYWLIFGSIFGLGLLGAGLAGLIAWIMITAVSLLLLSLGLLLGVGVLKTFIKNPTAQARMDQTITKLAPYQGTLGIIAILVGLASIVTGILF